MPSAAAATERASIVPIRVRRRGRREPLHTLGCRAPARVIDRGVPAECSSADRGAERALGGPQLPVRGAAWDGGTEPIDAAWPRKWAAHSTWRCPRTSQARPRGRRVDIGGARPATGQSQLRRVGVGRKPTQPGGWTLEGVPFLALRRHHASGAPKSRPMCAAQPLAKFANSPEWAFVGQS